MCWLCNTLVHVLWKSHYRSFMFIADPNFTDFGVFQVLGLIRCPVYTMHDKQGGLPSFLRNNFVGNSRQQLLIGLEHAGILTQQEITEVVHFSKLIQASTPKLWQLWYGKYRYVELISSAVDNVAILRTRGWDGINPEAAGQVVSVLARVRGWWWHTVEISKFPWSIWVSSLNAGFSFVERSSVAKNKGMWIGHEWWTHRKTLLLTIYADLVVYRFTRRAR